MQNNLTKQDITNILNLIALAPIKGNEAMTVALLQQKLVSIASTMPVEETVPAGTTQDTSKDKKSK